MKLYTILAQGMRKMIQRIQRILPIIVVGFLFLIYMLLWYKQFSYFHYSGESYNLNDASLQEKAVGSEEKEFALNNAFSKRIGRIVFWPTKYSDITIKNSGVEAIALTVSDYEGSDIPMVSEPVVIPASGEFSFVADGRASYVLTGYGTQTAQAEEIQVQYNNHAYMTRWKK